MPAVSGLAPVSLVSLVLALVRMATAMDPQARPSHIQQWTSTMARASTYGTHGSEAVPSSPSLDSPLLLSTFMLCFSSVAMGVRAHYPFRYELETLLQMYDTSLRHQTAGFKRNTPLCIIRVTGPVGLGPMGSAHWAGPNGQGPLASAHGPDHRMSCNDWAHCAGPNGPGPLCRPNESGPSVGWDYWPTRFLPRPGARAHDARLVVSAVHTFLKGDAPWPRPRVARWREPLMWCLAAEGSPHGHDSAAMTSHDSGTRETVGLASLSFTGEKERERERHTQRLTPHKLRRSNGPPHAIKLLQCELRLSAPCKEKGEVCKGSGILQVKFCHNLVNRPHS